LSKETAVITMDPSDLRFEEEVAKAPYSLTVWLVYLRSKDGAKPKVRYMIYERALRRLPRSYKLWHAYLSERTLALRGKLVTDRRYAITANAFERALVHMHKMPRIWLDYTAHLIAWRRGTLTRRTFDRAIQALPLSQHERLWEDYIEWVKDFGVPQTAVHVFRRYLQFRPSAREGLIDYLQDVGQHAEAVKQLAVCLDEPGGARSSGSESKSGHHTLWMRLCAMCAQHAEEASSVVDVEAVMKSGIGRFSDEVGKLWCHLANFYTRLGRFERVRGVYEEALAEVLTVKDFSVVYDSYVKFEEAVLTNKMEQLEKDAGEGEGPHSATLEQEVDLLATRVEFLLDQRPILLTEVRLRQDPNNADEWYKRAQLLGKRIGDEKANRPAASVLLEAVATVVAEVASGRLSRCWLALGWYFDAAGDAASCRLAFQTATEVNFRTSEECGAVWCAWAEWELTQGHADKALAVMQRAVLPPSVSSAARQDALKAAGGGAKAGKGPSGAAVHKNIRVWSLYLDLEETVGTVETCKAAYAAAFDAKILTPAMAINCARFLSQNAYFEDAFKIFERAIDLFDNKFPHCKPLWESYLRAFIARYGGEKIERLRNLFEQSLSQCPEEDKASFFVQYATAEEKYGLARHCVSILERGATECAPDQRADIFKLCIKKTEKHFGLSHTRPVYERALAKLGEDDARALCEDFAAMETALGEIDRARAIYTHGSQFADVRYEPQYWVLWRAFEEAHGNEDTFREMLRVRRSVEAAKVGSHRVAEDLKRVANVPAATKAGGAGRADGTGGADRAKRGFVSGGLKGEEVSGVAPAAKRRSAADLRHVSELGVTAIPSAVFGSMDVAAVTEAAADAAAAEAAANGGTGDDVPRGALDRFKK
jgi:pre-mRNA-splicing factor SYF1